MMTSGSHSSNRQAPLFSFVRSIYMYVEKQPPNQTETLAYFQFCTCATCFLTLSFLSTNCFSFLLNNHISLSFCIKFTCESLKPYVSAGKAPCLSVSNGLFFFCL